MLAAGLGSCLAPQHVYVAEPPRAEWTAAEPAEVRIDNSDTVSQRTLDLVARYDTDFTGEQLVLSITTVTPDGFRWRDTVVLRIAPDDSRLGFYRDIGRRYREKVCLAQAGTYLFRLAPLPGDTVNGVTAVGIDIR